MVKLEVGKVYLRRDGEITGPLVESDSGKYPFLDLTTGNLYATNGQYLIGSPSRHDLIGEFAEQPQAPDPARDKKRAFDLFSGRWFNPEASNPAPAEKSVLQEAEEIINGARQQTHGAKLATFEMIAAFWSVYLKTEIKPQDVAQMMSLMKKARFRCGQHVRDHFVDDIGYTAIAHELGEDQ